jgi:hypothetical protein
MSTGQATPKGANIGKKFSGGKKKAGAKKAAAKKGAKKR